MSASQGNVRTISRKTVPIEVNQTYQTVDTKQSVVNVSTKTSNNLYDGFYVDDINQPHRLVSRFNEKWGRSQYYARLDSLPNATSWTVAVDRSRRFFKSSMYVLDGKTGMMYHWNEGNITPMKFDTGYHFFDIYGTLQIFKVKDSNITNILKENLAEGCHLLDTRTGRILALRKGTWKRSKTPRSPIIHIPKVIVASTICFIDSPYVGAVGKGNVDFTSIDSDCYYDLEHGTLHQKREGVWKEENDIHFMFWVTETIGLDREDSVVIDSLYVVDRGVIIHARSCTSDETALVDLTNNTVYSIISGRRNIIRTEFASSRDVTVNGQSVAGERGPRGHPGDVGERGPQGEKGDNGDNGDFSSWGGQTEVHRGPPGPAGPMGPGGNAGPPGMRGEQGVQGYEGVQGCDGRRGAVGDRGERGERGVDGLMGPQGDAGPRGDDGRKGDQGENGIQGEQGNVGATGGQGPKGPQGNVGARGERGPAGGQGVKGDEGPQGVEGVKGDREMNLLGLPRRHAKAVRCIALLWFLH